MPRCPARCLCDLLTFYCAFYDQIRPKWTDKWILDINSKMTEALCIIHAGGAYSVPGSPRPPSCI